VPISENQVFIDPAKKNELRDSPLYRSGFLNGATIYLDPRISGVRDDGVPWIGSPLIDATAYYQLVGVGVDRLMTKGGSVTLGVGVDNRFFTAPTNNPNTVVVRQGAVIDVSGGWVSYEAGFVRSTQLIDSTGHVVDISQADPNANYIGIANGWMRDHAHWGLVDTWTSSLSRGGGRWVPGYNEGRDAGVLILDNPIGTCSNVALLNLQRTIAERMRVQLIYTTGVDDLEALATLPNKIRLRNTHRDRATGHYHVTEEPDSERGSVEGVRLVEVPAR